MLFARASEEQAGTVEQVAREISKIDEVTKKNAVLVTEAIDASDEMAKQGADLIEQVASFKLGDTS